MTDARERVLGVAARTFAEFGWRDSTIDAVCRRADVPTAEFYAMYETVDDLFVEMYGREAQIRAAATRAALEPLTARAGPTSTEDAVSAVASAVSAAAEDRDWWIITTEYMLRAVRHPEAAASYVALRRSTHRAMVQIVTEALQAAGIADRVDADQFVELTTALHRGAVAHRFVDPDASRPQVLDEIAWTAVLDSLTRRRQVTGD